MRRPNYTEEDHKNRSRQFWELVQKHRNLSLTLLEPWVNPYHDIPATRLKEILNSFKHSFLGALPDVDMPVFISADENTRSAITFDHAVKLNARGKVIRLIANGKRWFEQNWNLFTGDYNFDSRREVLVTLPVDYLRLASLVSPLWDPNILINPGVSTTATGLKEISEQVESGKLVFAVTHYQLQACELHFHLDDAETVARCVYEAAHKTEWGNIRLGDGPEKRPPMKAKPQYNEAEGGVFRCNWKRCKEGYKLWVKGLPGVSATDESFQEASIRLGELICGETGDGEAVLDYSPLPPVAPALQVYLSPELVCVKPNEAVCSPRHPPGLFSGGYCPVCGRGVGARTETELEVDEFPEDADGVFCASVLEAGPIMSERLLKLLTAGERARLRLIRVKSKEPCRRKFYELSGDMALSFVGFTGTPGYEPRPCKQCGYVNTSQFFDSEMHDFVVAEDLPTPLPSLFFAGNGWPKLCMTADRWFQLRGKRGARGLVARRVYVIPKDKAICV